MLKDYECLKSCEPFIEVYPHNSDKPIIMPTSYFKEL